MQRIKNKTGGKNMNNELRSKLIDIAKKEIKTHDPSHDFSHALRVLKNAEMIAQKEGADMDVVVPASLFHDLIVYPKHLPGSKFEHQQSADKAEYILKEIQEYPKEKIDIVKICISTCSFSKAIKHTLLEAQVLQDADGLEATGAIAIMRTFASSGHWNYPFYDVDDPFCINREPDLYSKKYALDLFFVRLLKVQDRMYTQMAKEMAIKRTKFVRLFLNELNIELRDSVIG